MGIDKYTMYAVEHNVTRDKAIEIIREQEGKAVPKEEAPAEKKEDKAIKVTKEYKVKRKAKRTK